MISYLVERMANFLSRSFLAILLLISGHQALAQNVCVGDVILNIGNVSTVSIDINWSLTFGTVNGFRIEMFDVSAGTMSTINVTPSVNSRSLTSLSPGRSYNITVIAFKNICLGAGGNAESSFSETITVATIPTNPTATAASALSANSFTANWNASVGADSYRLDVSANNFVTNVAGFSDLLVNGTSQVVSGLASGTSYSYRVRAANSSGTSTNSNSIATKTISAAPVASTAGSVTTNSFTASWDASVGADSYRLDVSVDNFTTKLTGFNDLIVNGTSQAVSSLIPGTSYVYRVRALNATGTSVNSNIVTAKTISLPPVTLNGSSVTTSSFIASWNASVGADSYRLDVSANNFTNNLAGFNDLLVNSTSQAVSGLTPGTSYSYRVRAVNAGGISQNSNVMGTITISPAVIATAASLINETSFTANWQITTGASSYRLDVSMDDFATFLPGFNNLTVNATSQSINSLNAGTQYKYRARAVNASGTSVNSNTITAKTISSAPNQPSASNVGVDVFVINWNDAVGAESYLLDVSTDNFATFITGFNNKSVNSLSQLVSGLSPGTTYSFRVRAVNVGGVSANSLPNSQLTLPDAPQEFKTSDSQPSTIKVSWLSVQSATEYQLEVSSLETFAHFVNGYNPKVISGTTNIVVTGLESSTIYYFRIKAKNSSGLSSYSALQTASTLPSDGSIREIVFGSLQQPEVYVGSQQQEISISASGGIGNLSVNLFHRKKSEGSFTSQPVNLSNGAYRVGIDEKWFDVFGLEFYFEVTDLINQTKKSNTQTILSGINSVRLPVSEFGAELANYQIISIPYTLDRTLVRDVFEKVMGSYDKKKWRFSQYQNGRIIDYEEGIGASNLEQGKGYWFISKNEVDLSFGQGKSFGNSLASPFKLQLKKGWNQIGNPFPYNLSWQEVLTANSNPPIVSNLYVYDKASVSFTENDLLPVFGGGFVFIEEAMELNFPVTLTAKANGRIKPNAFLPELMNPEDWFIPIQLKQGEVINTMSGIGMLVNAKEDKDAYDKITAPRFVRFLEFNSRVSGYDTDLTRNISAPAPNKVWSYTIESNSNEPIELQWNNRLVESLNADLVLYDESKQRVINMANVDSYSTSVGARINLYYSREKNNEQIELIAIGEAFPNPFHDRATIPFDFSMDQSTSQVWLQVFDLRGILIADRKVGYQSSHVKSIQWDGRSDDGTEVESGIYIYKIKGQRVGGKNFNFAGKLIKQ